MPNLDKTILGKVDDENFGSTFYVVDSDYRTAAQRWTLDDGTGPLDLWQQRNRGRVFYTSGGPITSYATDAAAFQAAVDAAVDYRGDKVYLTPGSYSIATAVSLDCANLRLMGPRSRHPRSALVTVTATVDAAYSITAAGDDMEIAHHTVVPYTGTNFLDITAGAHRGYLHHLFYDATGVTGSTSTEFCNGGAVNDWLVEDCSFYVDAAQGDAFTLTSPVRWVWQRNDFMVGLTTIAWASVFTFATTPLGNIMRYNTFRGCGGATPAVFTNLVTGVANSNGQLMFYGNFIDGTALTTASSFETTFGTATDIEVAENYVTGDLAGEGGAVVALG